MVNYRGWLSGKAGPTRGDCWCAGEGHGLVSLGISWLEGRSKRADLRGREVEMSIC